MNYKNEYRKYKIAKLFKKEYNNEDFLKIYNLFFEYLDLTKYKQFADISNPDVLYFGNNDEDIIIKYDPYKKTLRLKTEIVKMFRQIRTSTVPIMYKTHFDLDVRNILLLHKDETDFFLIERKEGQRILFEKI